MRSCSNCEHFVWWDGDFCCLEHMTLLIESEEGRLTEMIRQALSKTGQRCKDYKRSKDYESK